MVELVTDRLRLRRARPEDAAAMHEVMRRPEAMRYWSTPAHADLEQTRDWLSGMIGAPAQESDDFIVEYGGRVIGKAGCWRVPEIGYILHPEVWGRGLAFEALSAIIPHVFAGFDIPAITADVDPRNEASLNLLAKLGFVETGRATRTWNVGGEWCDSIYLALARPKSPSPLRGEGLGWG